MMVYDRDILDIQGDNKEFLLRKAFTHR